MVAVSPDTRALVLASAHSPRMPAEVHSRMHSGMRGCGPERRLGA